MSDDEDPTNPASYPAIIEEAHRALDAAGVAARPVRPLTSRIDELGAALVAAEREVAQMQRRLDTARGAYRAAYERSRAAERKVRAVERVHCWTNEDGKRFMFVDDVATALEIPGT